MKWPGAANPEQSLGKDTVALLYPERPEDKSTNRLRLDSSLRRNLKAEIDNVVEIRRIRAI